MEDQGFEDAGCQGMILTPREAPTSLIGALEDIGAEESRGTHLGAFDYNIQKVASSNLAREIKSHEMHAAAWRAPRWGILKV